MFFRLSTVQKQPLMPVCLSQSWKVMLQASTEESIPAQLRLEDESRNLMELQCDDIEMPGQYQPGRDVPVEHLVHLERIGHTVAVIRRNATAYRQLTLHGSDGRPRYFIVQTNGQNSPTGEQGSDNLVLQLHRVLLV